MNDENLKNGKKFKSGEEATRLAGAKGGSSEKRKQTLNAKRLMKKLLLSTPPMTEKIKESINTIGVDDMDEEMVTNAGLIAATIIAQALNGDRDAARMAFEMSGEYTTTRDIHDKQKIDLERKRVTAELSKTNESDSSDSTAFNDIVSVFRQRMNSDEDR